MSAMMRPIYQPRRERPFDLTAWRHWVVLAPLILGGAFAIWGALRVFFWAVWWLGNNITLVP